MVISNVLHEYGIISGEMRLGILCCVFYFMEIH